MAYTNISDWFDYFFGELMRHNGTNVTNSSAPGKVPPSPARVMAGFVELVVSIIGVPANLTVLCIWIWLSLTGGRSSQRHDSRVHNNSRWFIFGLTLADLLFTAVHSPLIAHWYAIDRELNYHTCSFLLFSTHACTVASSMNVLLLSVDKFLYILIPLRYDDVMTKPKAVALLIASWVLALSWAFGFTMGPVTIRTSKCGQTYMDSVNAYVFFVVVFFVLPIGCSFLINVYIAYIVIRAKSSMATAEQAAKNRSASVITIKIESLATRLKTIAYVFITSTWCTITCLPYRLVIILITLDLYNASFDPDHWLFYAIYCLWAMTAMGDPFITIFTQPHYRNTLKNAVCFCKGYSERRGSANMTSSYGRTSVTELRPLKHLN